MTDLNIDGGPIFIDVSTGQQYRISEFSQLLPEPQELPVTPQELPVTPQEVKNELQDVPPPTTEEPEAQPTQEPQVIIEIPPAIDAPSTAAAENCIKIQQRRIKCPECQRFSAETEEKMIRHIRKVHRGENPFQCYMCEYSTYNKVLFEEHVRIHQGIKPYKCSHCPYRSVSKKNTKKHELIHRPDNPLRCTECDFIGRNPQGLGCHKKLHEVSVKLEECGICPKCPFIYKTNEELRLHKKNKRRCKECGVLLCTRRLLTVHKIKAHKHSKKPVVKVKVKTDLFKCALCKWSSSSKPRILLHLIHHPNQAVDKNIVDIHILRECGIME